MVMVAIERVVGGAAGGDRHCGVGHHQLQHEPRHRGGEELQVRPDRPLSPHALSDRFEGLNVLWAHDFEPCLCLC